MARPDSQRETIRQVMNRRAHRLWSRYREQILYLIVGVWNMLFAYGVFSILYFLLNKMLHPSAILLLAYLISSVNGFVGYRYVVFRSAGHPVAEYMKFQLVYGPLFLMNAIVLPLALKYTSMSAYVIQALFSGFAVIASYLGNKYFSFRRSGSTSVRANDDAE